MFADSPKAGAAFIQCKLNHVQRIDEYQPLVKNLMDTFGPMMTGASAPENIAEAVYTAVTDGTDRLRYEAGADASQILSKRKVTDDATFMAAIRTQFGLNQAPA